MAAKPIYQEKLKLASQPQPLQPVLPNPGYIPPYMALPQGVVPNTVGVPFMPGQQPSKNTFH